MGSSGPALGLLFIILREAVGRGLKVRLLRFRKVPARAARGAGAASPRRLQGVAVLLRPDGQRGGHGAAGGGGAVRLPAVRLLRLQGACPGHLSSLRPCPLRPQVRVPAPHLLSLLSCEPSAPPAPTRLPKASERETRRAALWGNDSVTWEAGWVCQPPWPTVPPHTIHPPTPGLRQQDPVWGQAWSASLGSLPAPLDVTAEQPRVRGTVPLPAPLSWKTL